MSLDYSMWADIRLTPEQALRVMVNATDPQAEITDIPDPPPVVKYAYVEPVNIWVYQAVRNSRMDEIYASLGIMPTLNFGFNMSWDDSLEGFQTLLRGTLALLNASEGDAILFYYDIGTTVLVRKSGQLILSSEYHWDADRLKPITQPYTVEAYPTLK